MRIATWNVRGLRDDTRLLTEVLLAARPEVLCLQEAPLGWRSAGRLRRWADGCGLAVAAQAANRETALLVSPQVEVVDAGDLDLPFTAGRPPRAAAWAEVEVAGQRATVMSVHLGLDPGERLDQAMVLRSAAAKWSGLPLIIAGDLNERLTGPAARVAAEGLQDAGAAENAPTFPARQPTRRIDAVLVDPRLRVISCRTFTGLDRATDHCPVIVDLEPA